MEQGLQKVTEIKQRRAQMIEKAADDEATEFVSEGEPPGDKTQQRQFEMNLDPSYWKTRFLYPFALDKAPIRLDGAKQSPMDIIAEKKRQKILGDESILNTKKYQFPYNQIKKIEYLQEIQKPIGFSLEDIKLDMYKYAKEFKKECIPHISEQHEIVDTIHNYPRPPKEK